MSGRCLSTDDYDREMTGSMTDYFIRNPGVGDLTPSQVTDDPCQRDSECPDMSSQRKWTDYPSECLLTSSTIRVQSESTGEAAPLTSKCSSRQVYTREYHSNDCVSDNGIAGGKYLEIDMIFWLCTVCRWRCTPDRGRADSSDPLSIPE